MAVYHISRNQRFSSPPVLLPLSLYHSLTPSVWKILAHKRLWEEDASPDYADADVDAPRLVGVCGWVRACVRAESQRQGERETHTHMRKGKKKGTAVHVVCMHLLNHLQLMGVVRCIKS